MTQITAFIGGGNMAAALIGGLLRAGRPSSSLRVAVRTDASAVRLREAFGVLATCDVKTAIEGADVIVLAVKPQQLADIVKALGTVRIGDSATLISVLGGVRLATLAQAFGGAPRIVRAMPNTPARVGRGITAVYAALDAPAKVRADTEALLGAAGSVCWLAEEALIDPASTVSGCGPALFYAFTEALAAGGTALGLAPAVASQLAVETFIGAAYLAEAADEDIARLRAQVTSKAGMTEAVLASFADAGLAALVQRGLEAGVQRARERADAAAEELNS